MAEIKEMDDASMKEFGGRGLSRKDEGICIVTTTERKSGDGGIEPWQGSFPINVASDTVRTLLLRLLMSMCFQTSSDILIAKEFYSDELRS